MIISPTIPLPNIIRPVNIDGVLNTVTINGQFAGGSTNGLVFSGGASTVKNLIIIKFGDNGLTFNWLGADQVHGFGPEIYRLEQAEPGEYVIRVNYFRPTGVTRAHVVAIGGGKVVCASVELARRDQMVEALRITIPER